jgi:hypothetical protein
LQAAIDVSENHDASISQGERVKKGTGFLSLPPHLGSHDHLPLTCLYNHPELTLFNPENEAASSPEELTSAHKTTPCHNPEDHNLNNYRRENLETYNVKCSLKWRQF